MIGIRRRSRQGRNRFGLAVVELALILPVLLILALGILDFSRVCSVAETIQSSANVGALYASRAIPSAGSTPPVVEAVLAESADLDPPIDPQKIKVEYTSETVIVTIEYTFEPLSGSLFGEDIVLRRSMTYPNLAP